MQRVRVKVWTGRGDDAGRKAEEEMLADMDRFVAEHPGGKVHRHRFRYELGDTGRMFLVVLFVGIFAILRGLPLAWTAVAVVGAAFYTLIRRALR